MDTNTKFSHKNQINSYEENPHQPLKYYEKNLDGKLVFLLSSTKDK